MAPAARRACHTTACPAGTSKHACRAHAWLPPLLLPTLDRMQYFEVNRVAQQITRCSTSGAAKPNPHLAFSASGASGWKTDSDRTNSPNSITEFCLMSNSSNTYEGVGRQRRLGWPQLHTRRACGPLVEACRVGMRRAAGRRRGTLLPALLQPWLRANLQLPQRQNPPFHASRHHSSLPQPPTRSANRLSRFALKSAHMNSSRWIRLSLCSSLLSCRYSCRNASTSATVTATKRGGAGEYYAAGASGGGRRRAVWQRALPEPEGSPGWRPHAPATTLTVGLARKGFRRVRVVVHAAAKPSCGLRRHRGVHHRCMAASSAAHGSARRREGDSVRALG